MADEEIDYKKLYELERNKNRGLQDKLDAFSLPSEAKLFYALNKQRNDLADMLNGINLKTLTIDDPKDKTIERLKMIWAAIGSIAPIVADLRVASGVTGNESADMAARKPFIETIAERRD